MYHFTYDQDLETICSEPEHHVTHQRISKHYALLDTRSIILPIQCCLEDTDAFNDYYRSLELSTSCYRLSPLEAHPGYAFIRVYVFSDLTFPRKRGLHMIFRRRKNSLPSKIASKPVYSNHYINSKVCSLCW